MCIRLSINTMVAIYINSPVKFFFTSPMDAMFSYKSLNVPAWSLVAVAFFASSFSNWPFSQVVLSALMSSLRILARFLHRKFEYCSYLFLEKPC